MKRSPEARLTELATAYRLNDSQRDQLAGLLDLLAGAHAPTSVRHAERAVDVHIADSLTGLEISALDEPRMASDLGSGAGLPGLVIAIARPHTHVRLLESNRRKCAFIAEAARALGIANAESICARAEEWAGGLGANDVVLARAVGPQPVVLEYAAPLMRAGGALVDWRGARDQADEDAALVAAAELGLERVEFRAVAPYPGAKSHHLHVFTKARETPTRFPRRAGVARKRPLGRGA